MKKLVLLLSIILCSIQLSAQTFVDLNATGNNDGTSWADAYTSLESAVSTVSSGEIRVASGTYTPSTANGCTNCTTSPNEFYFLISTEITLKGSYNPTTGIQDYTNPSILDGQGIAYNVVIVTGFSLNATIDGFTIQGGAGNRASSRSVSSRNIRLGSGGGMHLVNSSPSLTNITFANNSANLFGGGLYISSSFPSLTNITFTNNSTNNRGGGMHNTNTSSSSLTNVTFSANHSEFRGGGIYNESSLSLNNVIFTNNSASSDGGGMYADNSSQSNLNNVTFTSNSATNSGGGMYINENNISVTLTNVRFSTNTTVNNNGAGLYNSSMAASTSLINVTFSANQSGFRGGGMHNNDSSPILTNVIFTDNTSTDLGAGLSNSSSSPTLINVTLANNSSAATNSVGGIVSVSNSAPVLYNMVLYNNGIDIFSSSDSSINANSANNFSENFAQTGFTALTADPFTNSADPDGADNLFGTGDDGLVPATGSPLVNAGDTAQLPVDTQDIDNDGDTTEQLPIDITGEVRVFDATVDVGAYEKTPCVGLPTILYVDAAATGGNNGSSWADAFVSLGETIALQDCGFTGEMRVASGTYNPTDARLCTNCTADANENYFLINTNIIVRGSYNPATDMQDYTNPSILDGQNTAYNVLITTDLNNTATINGFTIQGGNSNRTSNRTVNSKTIVKETGGAMYNAAGSPSFSNITFTNNTATDDAGAMYNDAASPSLTNALFTNNTAGDNGGAMSNNNASPSLVNVVFSSNTTSDNGGGLFNFSSSPSLTNVVFSGNSASFLGGAMANDASSPTLVNVTFSNNSAIIAGGLFNDNSAPILYNTVFFNNGTDIDGDAINSISANNASDGTGGNIANGSGFVTLTADPFTNSADPDGADNLFGTTDDGLLPVTGSPLLDAGDNTKIPAGITTDIAGQARIENTTVDVGAYELDQGSVLSINDFNIAKTISAYPNPVGNILRLKNSLNTNFKYEVYNIQGKRILSSNSETSKTIDFSNYATGLYVIKVQTDNAVETLKIIKE